MSACTTAAFSVAPSMSPSGCFTPLPSMPIAATSTRSPNQVDAVDLHHQQVELRQVRGHPLLHACSRERDEVARWPPTSILRLPAGAGTSPSGNRTARLNLRVDTLISIGFTAHWPSQSSSTACSQLASASSFPRRARVPEAARLRPCQHGSRSCPPCAPSDHRAGPRSRECRGPHATSASASIIAPSVSIPAARQNRSNDADTSSHALPTGALGIALVIMVDVFMALLSFRANQHPEPTGSRRQQRRSL